MSIDIASGNVQLYSEDASILGRVNLIWDRRYSSSLLTNSKSGLGPGWITRYDVTLTRRAEGFDFVTPSGMAEFISEAEGTVERGAVVRKVSANLEVFMQGERYIVQTWGHQSEVRRFVFTPGSVSGPMRLDGIENVSGQGLALSWDSSGRLSRVRQRIEMRELHLNYDGKGLLIEVDLQARNGAIHRLARYEYNDGGQLSAAFDPLDHAHRYEYEANGRLSREIGKDATVRSYQYDKQGRCVWTSGLDRYDEKRLHFLDTARITEVTDSYGSRFTYQYLPTGQIVNEWDPFGSQTAKEYDVEGRIVAKTTATGDTTRYEYDDAGNISKVTDPVGATYSIKYNENHQPTAVTDPLGAVWTRYYDPAGNLVRIENPLGGNSTWDCDSNGNRIRATSANGATTTFRYRPDGTLHQVIQPSGATRSVLFNDFGRPLMNINSLGGVVQTRYDAAGRVLEIVRPDGTALQYRYDPAGNIVQKTDALGHTTRFEWGPCGRLLKRTDALGRTVTYEWGTEIDRLLKIVNEVGDALTFRYDVAGRIVEEHSFDDRVTLFAYDVNNFLIRRTVGSEEAIEYSYDSCGRLIGRLSDGSSESYKYDLAGRVVAAENGSSKVEFEYDLLGNVIAERQDSVAILNSFDVGGRLMRRQTSLGLDFRFSRDGADRPIQIEVLKDRSFSFVYNRVGSETSRSLPGGLRFGQSRDDRGRVSRQFVVAGSSGETPDLELTGFLNGIISRSFRYDANSAPLAINDRRLGDSVYAYDAAEQLLSAEYSSGAQEVFQYTSTGSLSSISTSNTAVVFEYGKGNRLVRRGVSVYEYDASGRRVRKARAGLGSAGWVYSWSSLGHLRSVKSPSGDEWTYAYDALGRRITKSGPTGTTRFIWAGDAMLQTVASRGSQESWLFDETLRFPIAKIEDGRVYSVVTDHLGLPRELVAANGQIVWSTTLSGWGGVSVSTESKVDCPLRFPGQYFDAESGLHYNRFRYFDPEIGQFISQDPIGTDGGINLYRYAPNPLNYFDLLGLDICANKKKGDDFQNAVKDELEKAGYTVHSEVTIKVTAKNGKTSVKTRVDLLVFDSQGNPILIETKASSTAPYTDNQKTAGVPTGKLDGSGEYRSDRGGGIDRGTAVPASATTVTVRPGDPIPLTGPPPVTAPHPPPP